MYQCPLWTGRYKFRSEKVPKHPNFAKLNHINKGNKPSKHSKDIQCNDPDSQSNASKSKENQSNTRSECWWYFYNDRGSVRDLPHNDVYDSKGDHGLEYDASIDAEFDKDKIS